ncbi:MAG: hypothetical protein AB1918_14520 [Pseudomonadota bacterium]
MVVLFIILALLVVLTLGNFALDILFRREIRRRLDALEDDVASKHAQSREALAAAKLEIAKSYASVGLLKDVENRITAFLIRIEAKIGGAP